MCSMNLGMLHLQIKKMSLCMRKPTIPISDHLWRKPACTVTDAGKRLEILDLESRGTVLSI